MRAWTARSRWIAVNRPERAALRRLDQPRIGAGQRGEIALLDVGDDQHLAIGGIIERARRLEPAGRAGEVERAGARLGIGPVGAAAAQRRRGDEHAMGGLQHGLGERPGRIEPVAVEAEIIFAALDPLDREPVDEIGIGRAADPGGERDPGLERLDAARRGRRSRLRRGRGPGASSQSGASSITASSLLPSATSGRSSSSSASSAGAAASTRAGSSSAISVSRP